MNRYKKAAPSNEVEGTYQMIKCPVCGFKDATSDPSTWTCPECDDKKESTRRVVADVKKAIASPLVSPELKKALQDYVPALEKHVEPNKETQEAIADSYAGRVEKVENGLVNALADLCKSMGIESRKPPQPPKPELVKEFKVGGFQCKIVKTGRE